MSDDIVTRLRNSCHTRHIKGLPCTIVAPQGCPPCEAADEIKRLRKEVNRLHREMDMELFGESEYEEDE